MKIDAFDQDAQLRRYEKYAKSKNKEYNIFYLTIDGRDASDQSTSGLEKDYLRISFSHHILEWLNACIGITPQTNKARIGLTQYLELVEKLISERNRKGNKAMSLLLQNAENYRAYLELVKSEQTMKEIFLEKFFLTFEKRLKQVNPEFRSDRDETFKTNLFLNNPNNRIGFSLDTGEQLVASNGRNYSLIFCIDIGEREGNMALGFSLAEIPDGIAVPEIANIKTVIITEDDKANIYKMLNYENNNAKVAFEDSWIDWDYFYSEKQTKFNLRTFNDPIIDMLDNKEFEQGMDRMIGTINNYLGKVKKRCEII